MQFNGFSQKGINFLKELSLNNTKEWFELHRHIWEQTIHTPNISFVKDMGETLQILEPNINFEPKVSKSLFKIYRDIRFSKDKTPMKSKIGILFWKGNGHRMQSSSFYIHYDKNEYFIASGIRNFKPELLKQYRKYIQNEKKREELHFIIEDLKQKGYNFPKPKFKRIPKDFNKDDKYIYLCLYGAIFSYYNSKIEDTFFKIDFLDKAFQIYQDMHKLHIWVYNMTLK